jgi:arabinofuranan 3-O-arabinosyltransferase
VPIRRPRRPDRFRWIRIGDVALAVASYLPLLLTHRGKLGADTKTYLYIDPGRLLSRAPYLWDPAVGLGTVTHQNIGYLFPMGPYYLLASALHVPDWIAQRIWMGSVIFLAGLGVRYLLRTLRWEGPGTTVAAFAYALSPYLLHYIYKHSVILLPFTALPWLVAFSARAIRQGGWRYPSLFALVTLAAGGVNATSLLLVMIGPLLWVLHSVFVERETTLRKVWPPLLRIGLLTLVTSLWWMAGLLMQGGYGIDILRYTETYKTVASASTGPEVFRGLGYWFFYGTDALGPWFKSAVTETQSLPAIALSFLVPGVAIVAALLTRFRYRVFFVGLAAAGMVISIGAHPLGSSTVYGRIFNAFTATDSGLALRSAPRAEPMWILAAAVFLGAGVAALTQWRPQWRLAFAGVALLAVVANLSPLWMGRLLDPYLERDVDVPSYWREAGAYLDRGDASTRALEIPGLDFAYYRWGASVDTILPGVTTRDTAGRELVPWGSPASADMTNAIDAGFQDGSFDPDGYAAVLKNLSVGDLVVRNDLQYERFKAPRPATMADWIGRAATASHDQTGDATIGAPHGFGPTAPNAPSPAAPLIDSTELALPRGTPRPHAVEVRPISGTTPIVSTFPETHPTIVAGSADGIVGMANAGILGAQGGVLRYSGSVTNHPSQLDALLEARADLVVTDTNRKAGHRWGALRDQLGYTEMAEETPRADPSDNRLDLFGRLDDPSTQTVVEQQGGLRVTASGYGNQLTFTPSDRAANAFDGDPATAWKVGAFSDVRGEWIQARSTTGPITTDHVGVLQAQRATNRFITKVRLTFDGKRPIDVTLDPTSRTGAGQLLRFPRRTFTTLRITVLDTDLGVRASYKNISGVGFTRIDLDGRRVTEVVRPPTDLLDAVGARSRDLSLSYVFRRQRTDPADPSLQSPEMRMIRQVDPPTERAFTPSGKVRLNTYVSDAAVDEELGVHGLGGVTFSSSSRLDGDVAARSSKAFDGDPATAWQTTIGVQVGSWIGVDSPRSGHFSFGTMDVVNDAHHSIPTAVHLVVDGVAGPTQQLEGVPSKPGRLGSTATLRLPHPDAIGSHVRIVVDRVAERTAPDWYTGRPATLPIAVAELAPGDASAAATSLAQPAPARLPSTCRTDLVTIGGTPVPMRIVGTTADAEAGHLLPLEACGGDTTIPAHATTVAAVDGRTTGFDVDALTLSSPRTPRTDPIVVPSVTATRTSRGSYDLRLDEVTAGTPFWLVLGQTLNPGWTLTLNGHDLGEPQLVNGYANGWLVHPADLAASANADPPSHLTGTLEWAPQSTVWIALALSALGLVACCVLLLPRFAGRRDDELRLDPSHPVGIHPFEMFGSAPAMRTRLGVTLASVVGALVFVQWYWVPLVAVLCWLALSTRWGWILLRAATIALLGATAAYVLAREWRGHFPDDFDWPLRFDAVQSLPAAAIALLCVEAVVEALRAGWRRTTGLDP